MEEKVFPFATLVEKEHQLDVLFFSAIYTHTHTHTHTQVRVGQGFVFIFSRRIKAKSCPNPCLGILKSGLAHLGCGDGSPANAEH